MTQTPILGLNKPQLGDSPPDITKISENLPIIDEALYSASQKLTSLSTNKFHQVTRNRCVLTTTETIGVDLNPRKMYKMSDNKASADYRKPNGFYITTDFNLTDSNLRLFTDDSTYFTMVDGRTISITYGLGYNTSISNGLYLIEGQLTVGSGTCNVSVSFRRYTQGSFTQVTTYQNLGVGTHLITADINNLVTGQLTSGCEEVKIEITATSDLMLQRWKVTRYKTDSAETVRFELSNPNDINLDLSEDEPLYIYTKPTSTLTTYDFQFVNGDCRVYFQDKQLDRVLEFDKYYILTNKGTYWTATEV